MNLLVVNGVDFSGELPGEWTIAELVKVLEREVLFQDEIVIDVTVDGAPFCFGPDEGGPSLDAVDRVTVESRKVDEVILAAIGSAGATLERYLEQSAEAVDALRFGRENAGWDAQRRSLVTLQAFVELCDRLGTTLQGGLGPGPAKGAEIHAIARGIGERLGAVEIAAQVDDVVELCDGLEDLADWLHAAWDTLWIDQLGADTGAAGPFGPGTEQQ